MKRRKLSYSSQILIISYLLLMLVFVFVVIVDVLTFKSQNLFISLSLLALLVVSYPAYKIFDNFWKGDEGELDVRNVLETLPSESFYHLQDIMFPDSKINIDFVVVGITGAWAIEVKNYRAKKIVLNDYLKKDIWEVKKESKSLESFLQLPVRSVLVYTNKKTKIRFGMSPVDEVYVIGISWLKELIEKHSSGYIEPQNAYQIKESLKNHASRI